MRWAARGHEGTVGIGASKVSNLALTGHSLIQADEQCPNGFVRCVPAYRHDAAHDTGPRAAVGQTYTEVASAVARAAGDVSLRIGFAVAPRDRHGVAHCEDAHGLAAMRPQLRELVSRRLSVRPASPAQRLALVDEVAHMVEAGGHSQHVTAQHGLPGVPWCSLSWLEAIARALTETGRPLHMHLLETRYQCDRRDRAHPQGIAPVLDRIGLLGPRLALARCTWARSEELDLLAERGVAIAVNTS